MLPLGIGDLEIFGSAPRIGQIRRYAKVEKVLEVYHTLIIPVQCHNV